MRRLASFQRWIIIGFGAPVVALNVWVLSQVVSYFDHLFTVLTVAAILAFLLNYPVKFFEKARITHTQAVIIVLLVSVTLLVVLAFTIVPLIFEQLQELLLGIPAWLEMSQDNLAWVDKWARARRLPLDLTGFSNRITTRVESQLQAIAGEAFGLALGTLSGLVDTALVVVLAFYMLLYGEVVWRGLIDLLPSPFGAACGASLQLNFHNFFITQLILGLFMFVALTPIFLALKLPFALLFALFIGSAELIPFIGATLGIGLVTLLVLVQNWWLAVQVALFAIAVQQVKDNILAPRLMGNFTGLNPIWIFVALLIGAEIAGFLGALVAVPVAGTIKGTIDYIRAQPNKVVSTVIFDDNSPNSNN